MADADSNAVAAAAKKRLRREARIRENYDRISAALSLSDSKATKNPTRNVPDVPGFQSLSKTEIKRDTKDIEKNSNFSFSKERNYTDEMDACVSRSMRPHCAAESTLLKKKRRLLSWVNHPEQADKELDFWRSNVAKSRESFAQFEADRESWLDGIQEARRMLSGALKSSIEANKRMREDGAMLHNLCEQECGHALRKKRNFHTKDIVDEVVERQSAYESTVQEYLSVTKDLHAKHVTGTPAVPVTFLSLDEVHYPEDDVYIVNKNRVRKTEPLRAAVQDKAQEEINVKTEPVVKLESEDAMEVVEAETRECISDIPLPYFCSETKSVIADKSDVPFEPVTVAAAAPRKGRSSSIGSLKDIAASAVPAVVKTERSSSGGSGATSAEATTDNDATHPSSATSSSARCWSPSDPSSQSESAAKSFDDLSLLELMLSVQESVRLNELSLTDVEFMFQDRTTCPDDKSIIDSILSGETAHSKASKVEDAKHKQPKEHRLEGLSVDEQRSLAAPYLSLSRTTDANWGSYCNQLFDGLNSQGIITRKGKKRGPEFIQVAIDLRLRTHRGVSLLLSPLSQYEDRMLGVSDQSTIYSAHTNQSTGEVTYHSTTQLPPYLRAAEEDALARCKLQSAAAIAGLSIRKLRASLKEISKFTQEAHNSLLRSESLYEMAAVEEGLELRKMYKELVHYGLVEAGAGEPPMSPLSSTAAAAAASALFTSVYGGQSNNHHGKAQSKSRAPARVYARPSQAAAMAAAAAASAAEMVDDATSNEGMTKSSSVSDYDPKFNTEAVEEEPSKRKISAAATASAPKRRR